MSLEIDFQPSRYRVRTHGAPDLVPVSCSLRSTSLPRVNHADTVLPLVWYEAPYLSCQKRSRPRESHGGEGFTAQLWVEDDL